MANPMRAQVKIALAGKDYKARLTVDSIMQIEDAVGCGIIKLAQRMSEADIRMSDIINVLLPALRGGGNDLQLDDVKRIVGDTGLVESAKAVAELLTKSLTTDSGEEEGEVGKKKE